jgi:hypothetical protein
MNFDDEHFEQHLRSFRPRTVRPLPTARARALSWQARLAVIGVTVVLVAVLFLIPRPKTVRLFSQFSEPAAPTRVVTVRQLNAAEKDGELEDALTVSAARALPRTDQPHTALNTLAKE